MWRVTGEIKPLLPALSHVVLALAVISMSWIEWSRAVEVQTSKDPLTTIFQVRFFLLLLDVGLVFLYFALAREIDIDVGVVIAGGQGAVDALEPDVHGAVYWSSLILGGYVLYDFVTDVLMKANLDTSRGRHSVTPARNRRQWIRDRCTDALIGCYSSLICFGFVVVVIKRSVPWDQTVGSVFWTNCALLAMFVVFRVLKFGESALAEVLPGADQGYFRSRRCGPVSAA